MLATEKKQEIIKVHKMHEKDTGSPEVQIALLSERINSLGPLFQDQQERSSFEKRASQDGRHEETAS